MRAAAGACNAGSLEDAARACLLACILFALACLLACSGWLACSGCLACSGWLVAGLLWLTVWLLGWLAGRPTGWLAGRPALFDHVSERHCPARSR